MDMSTHHFTLPRKMVAAMTGESWERVPHAVFTTEVSLLHLRPILEEINARESREGHITLNTALLKVIAEALKAAPGMNGHIRYRRGLVQGTVTRLEHIDVSLPVCFKEGFTIPVNLRHLEEKSMREIRDTLADTLRRVQNTNMEEVMFDVSIHDTLLELRRLHVGKAVGRLLGALFSPVRLRTLTPRQRRAYRRIPENERLTRRDLEQGSITISNIGSLYPGWKGECTLLEVVPPQLAVIAIGAARDNVLPLTVAFDHRALDAADVMPFIRRLDEILSSPDILRGL